MRTPSAQHIEGFFLGMNHAISVGERRKRFGTSYILDAQRNERTALKMSQELNRITTERGAAAQPLKAAKTPENAPAAAPHRNYRRDSAITAALVMSAIFGHAAWLVAVWAWELVK